MKKLFLLFFCLCVNSMLWAKENLLVIDFTDGTEVTFALAKQPVISFAEQRLLVSVEGEMSEFELADVANFHFREELSDIRSVSAENEYHIVWAGNDCILIFAAPTVRASLYGIDGTLYPNRVKYCGRIEISLSDLPKGNYLITINNSRTIKINRK